MDLSITHASYVSKQVHLMRLKSTIATDSDSACTDALYMQISWLSIIDRASTYPPPHYDTL